MRFVHTSDLHLGYNQFGLDARLEDFSRAFEHIVGRTIELSADALVIAGDLFNKREMSAKPFLSAVELLEPLREADIPVIAVEGNHDKALRSDAMSWMEWLSQRGFLRLLRPVFQDGSLGLPEWDESRRAGARTEVCGVEFCGLGYLGARTEAALEQLPAQLGRAVSPRVLILHAGLGNHGPDIGRISAKAFEPLRDAVDYVALGHVHGRYESDGWAFNPGAPENWDLGECAYEKGYYIVSLDGNGRTMEYERSQRRPAVVLRVDVTGAESPQAAADKVMSDTQGAAPEEGALCRLVVGGDTSFSPSDVDTAALAEAITERDGWLYVEMDNRINQGAFALQDGLLAGSRREIEREVLAGLVERDGVLGAFGERAVAALFELKELATARGDAAAMAELALKLADMEREKEREADPEPGD